ncbi:hypothetical protein ROHU_012541 [Labeo rohita]|uniref:Secreted protein n=1 Tax=Labeo rohita TaxID=84645 RepID=A0A498LC74_LABRO|nr:hypothetical protein ROHU_012541 [Labeo rohita]
MTLKCTCCHTSVTWFLTSALHSALLGSPVEFGADLSSGLWERGGRQSHLECDCMFLPAGITPALRDSVPTHAASRNLTAQPVCVRPRATDASPAHLTLAEQSDRG